jgi:putative transposase
VASAEDGAGWLAFLRGLVVRGLSGAQLAISMPIPDWSPRDRFGAAGSGLAALPHALPAQLAHSGPEVRVTACGMQVLMIFDQADADAAVAQFERVVDALETNEAKYCDAGEHLEAAREDLLAFTSYPRELWRQIWSNNPKRLSKEIRCRTDVVGIFPDRDTLIRLVGAVVAEQSDEWTENRRYMNWELLAKCRIRVDGAMTGTELIA